MALSCRSRSMNRRVTDENGADRLRRRKSRLRERRAPARSAHVAPPTHHRHRTCPHVRPGFDEFLAHAPSRVTRSDLASLTLSSYRRVLEIIRRPPSLSCAFRQLRIDVLMFERPGRCIEFCHLNFCAVTASPIRSWKSPASNPKSSSRQATVP